jgi:hypothetical protein
VISSLEKNDKCHFLRVISTRPLGCPEPHGQGFPNVLYITGCPFTQVSPNGRTALRALCTSFPLLRATSGSDSGPVGSSVA